MENTWIYAVVAAAIVVLAAAAAWVEWRVERREVPRHRKVLDSERGHRDRLPRRR